MSNNMNIKNLLILAVFVVGVTPNNTRSGGEYYAPCTQARNDMVLSDTDDYENDELSQLAQLLEKQYANESNQSFRSPYSPDENEQEQDEDGQYIVIYEVK
jgi:hypothetical protein